MNVETRLSVIPELVSDFFWLVMMIYLILSCVLDIEVVLDIDWIVTSGVYDVANTLPPDERSEVVTAVGAQKYTFALRVVSGDVSLNRLQAWCRESSTGARIFDSFDSFNNLCLNHFECDGRVWGCLTESVGEELI